MTMQAQHRPLTRRLQAWVMRGVNGPMRTVLGAPFPTPLGRRLMLVTLTGRRSGTIYRQPLSYVRDGNNLLTPGGGRWTRNLVAGQPVSIRLRGRDLLARPEVVTDADDVQRLLGVITTANPAAKAFIGIPMDHRGHFDQARLDAAIRHGFSVVRWHPDRSQPGPGPSARRGTR